MIRAAKVHKSSYYKTNSERRSSQQSSKIMQIANKNNKPKDDFERMEKKELKIKINYTNERLVQILNVACLVAKNNRKNIL